jgi:hypothetical protein
MADRREEETAIEAIERSALPHRRFGVAFLLAAGALAAVSVASACGSSARARAPAANVTVSVHGRIGPLRMDVSNRSGVVSFAGRPQAERRGRTDHGIRYDALGYGCGGRPGAYAIPLVHGGPRCRTVFFLKTRSGRLGLFYTTQSRYVESHGVRVGMTTATAERLLRRVVRVGCESNIFLDSAKASLTVAFTGGKIRRNGTLNGGHVAALVLHGAHHDIGLFECM